MLYKTETRNWACGCIGNEGELRQGSRCLSHRLLGVGVGSTLLAGANDHVHEATVVLEALERTATRPLLLVQLLDLGSRTTHLTGTSQRSVHLACSDTHNKRALETASQGRD